MNKRWTAYVRGEDHPKARLTEEKVREILASSELSRVLAEHYGVHKSTIDAVRYRRTWRHVR